MIPPASSSTFRWRVLACAVVMQLGLGSTYAWAVFVEPLKTAAGISQALVQGPFSTFYFVFPLTMLALSLRPMPLAPHRQALIGGLLFGSGWIMAGTLGPLHFAGLWIGVGLLSGIGAGMAYLIPVSTAMAWFPKHKGLVTGIAVAGFGGGAALTGAVADALMQHAGWTPYQVLLVLGALFALLVSVAGFQLRLPAGDEADSERTRISLLPLKKIVGDPLFLRLFFTFAAGLAAGLTLIGHLKHLQGTSLSAGASLVAFFAAANAAGRITWGRIQDRFPSTGTLAANLLLTAGVLFTSPWFLSAGFLVPAFAVALGLCYGGILSIHPALAARHWGREQLQRVYGLLFAAHFPAVLMPPLAGRILEHTGTIRPALGICGGLCVLAAATLLTWRQGTPMSPTVNTRP